jgi:glucan phosphoethanolaminetransferase (alkaline phosphatase superfamily)
MYSNVLKSTLSLIVVLGHFMLLLLVVLMFFLSAFTFSELTTTIAILLPITSIYASTVIKEIIRDRNFEQQVANTKYTSSYALLSIALPLTFITYLFAIVLLKSFNIGVENFDQFKGLLVTGETIFAVYVGQIVHSMFDPTSNAARDSGKKSSSASTRSTPNSR